MGNLESALNSAFDEEIGKSEPVSTPADTPAPEPAKPAEPEPEPAEPEKAAAPEATPRDDEPTGDVLLDKLTPEQIAELKKDPRLKAIYKGLMSSYTPKMQQFAEQQRLWEALNNPETKRQAVEALARATGIELAPTDAPQREKAAEVADQIAEKWAAKIGPEAAAELLPLFRETAMAAIQGTIQPLQRASDYLQQDARARQAEAQVSQFRSLAEKNKWELTPDVEAKMAELGQQVMPAKPITTVQEGVEHLKRLYRLATADRAEADAEKRILERMNKAAQTAEPARGVPSVGREKRTNVAAGMSLSEALDVAFQEELAR